MVDQTGAHLEPRICTVQIFPRRRPRREFRARWALPHTVEDVILKHGLHWFARLEWGWHWQRHLLASREPGRAPRSRGRFEELSNQIQLSQPVSCYTPRKRGHGNAMSRSLRSCLSLTITQDAQIIHDTSDFVLRRIATPFVAPKQTPLPCFSHPLHMSIGMSELDV